MRNVTFEPTKTDDAPTAVFVTVKPVGSGALVITTATVAIAPVGFDSLNAVSVTQFVPAVFQA